MGVLEDAIREHLELKRKHGASAEELEQQEAEALGPARRGFEASGDRQQPEAEEAEPEVQLRDEPEAAIDAPEAALDEPEPEPALDEPEPEPAPREEPLEHEAPDFLHEAPR